MSKRGGDARDFHPRPVVGENSMEMAVDIQKGLETLQDTEADYAIKLIELIKLREASCASDDELRLFLAGKTFSLTNPLNESCHFFQKMTLVSCLTDFLGDAQAPPEMKEVSLDIIRNLSRHDMNRIFLYRVQSLVESLRSCVTVGNTPIVKELALITLNNLALADTNSIKLFELPGYVQMLMDSALNGQTVSIRVWSLGNLRNLAVANQNAVRMRQPPLEVPNILVTCAQRGNHSEVRTTALWALVNLTCGGQNRIALLFWPRLLETVVDAVLTDDTRKHAIKALLSFACAAENLPHLISYPNLVESIVSCVVWDWSTEIADEDVRRNGFRILCQFCSSDTNLSRRLLCDKRLMYHLVLMHRKQRENKWPAVLVCAMGKKVKHLHFLQVAMILCSAKTIPRVGKKSYLAKLDIDLVRLLVSVIYPSQKELAEDDDFYMIE